ncbi:MAG: hypothetical protein IPN03_14455 [Holophagales bacterium]|nr:hypothetical protein [Holophagales bacterium]
MGDAVESKTLVALGSRDARYQALRANEPGLGAFLDRFGTMFGERVTPTLIARFEAGSRPTAEEVISFRNAIALPVLLKAWADLSRSRQNAGALFAEYFEIHPAMTSSDGQSVVVNAEAYRDLRFGLGGFHGQAPAAIDPRHVKATFDPLLRTALVALLDAESLSEEPERFRQRVLTSMKFAMRAMRAPSDSLSDTSDWAAMVSMWVSAFEALSHPGGDAKVDFPEVSSRIKKTPWISQELTDLKHQAINRKPGELTTLPVQTYGRIYKLRNDCLHGVRHFQSGGLEEDQDAAWGQLQIQAPVLYRSVLLSSLADAGHCEGWEDSGDPLTGWRQREFEAPLFKPWADRDE